MSCETRDANGMKESMGNETNAGTGNPSEWSLLARQNVIDSTGKSWIIGEYLFEGSHAGLLSVESNDPNEKVANSQRYVIKIDCIGDDGSSTVKNETDILERIAKPEKVNEWKKEHKTSTLEMPQLIASGEHEFNDKMYYFVILPRFDMDFVGYLNSLNDEEITPRFVLQVALAVLDILEYIHQQGCLHNDIKPDNILVELAKDGSGKLKLYLCDFGLACDITAHSAQTDGPFCGTMDLAPRDVHDGCRTKRGEIESLIYNLIEWLGGTLPWKGERSHKSLLTKKCLMLRKFSNFFEQNNPVFSVVAKLVANVRTLQRNDTPDYGKIRDILKELSHCTITTKEPKVGTGKRKNCEKDEENFPQKRMCRTQKKTRFGQENSTQTHVITKI